MRTAITLAIHKGGELVEMLEGPLTPIDEQRARFKQARQAKTHDRFERIELWESGAGRILHHDYHELAAPPAPAEPPSTPVEPAPAEPPPAPAEPPSTPVEPAPAEPPPAPDEPPAAEQTEADADASGEFDVQPATGRRRRR